MINISEQLVSELYSNYIPKCEAYISIKGATYYNYRYSEYEVVSLDTSQISNLKISQKTDIFGRELPSITANWEQYAIMDDENIVDQTIKSKVYRKMAVDISFVYFVYGESKSWKSVFEEHETWQDVLDENESWALLLSNEKQEVVEQRRLFLTNPPVLNGDKWVWEARDLLYFLEKESDTFAGDWGNFQAITHNLRTGIAQKILLGEKTYGSSRIFDQAIENSKELTSSGYGEEWNQLIKPQVVSGKTKNIIKDLFSCVNGYITFGREKGSLGLDFVYDEMLKEPTRTVLLENMRSFPKKEQSISISNYIFDFSEPNIDRKNPYELTVKGVKSSYYFPDYESTYRYNFDGVGTPYDASGDVEFSPPQYMFQMRQSVEEKKATFYINNSSTTDSNGQIIIPTVSLTVYPINTAYATDVFSGSETDGEDNFSDFVEKNKLNVYSKTDNFAENRNSLLRKYFNKDSSIVNFETFGDTSIEIGDVVFVEINESGESGYKMIKCVVVGNELTYNGYTSQKITAHQLLEGD